MQNDTKPLKIYYEGRYSRWETYKPVIQAKLVTLGTKVDYWFTHYGAWPSGASLFAQDERA